jgi:hypothetical protein
MSAFYYMYKKEAVKLADVFLKGQCHEIFTLVFIHQITSPCPVRHALKGFRHFLNIRRVICILNQLPIVFINEESRLPGD